MIGLLSCFVVGFEMEFVELSRWSGDAGRRRRRIVWPWWPSIRLGSSSARSSTGLALMVTVAGSLVVQTATLESCVPLCQEEYQRKLEGGCCPLLRHKGCQDGPFLVPTQHLSQGVLFFCFSRSPKHHSSVVISQTFAPGIAVTP